MHKELAVSLIEAWKRQYNEADKYNACFKHFKQFVSIFAQIGINLTKLMQFTEGVSYFYNGMFYAFQIKTNFLGYIIQFYTLTRVIPRSLY